MTGPKYNVLKPEYQICFPLYAASREVIKRYRPYLDELNLTYTQYIAMMVLWDRHSVSAKELGTRLFLDSGTLTPVLKSLESKGFVRRERSLEDERVLMVTVTETGEALKEQAAEIPRRLASCVGLEDEEAAQLHTLLYKLLKDFAEN